MEGRTWPWALALVLLVAALAELMPGRAGSPDSIMHLSWRSGADGARREISEPVAAAICAQVARVGHGPQDDYAVSITCDPR